ncbi:hypothetical protein J6590_046199 [Homalodisca vitripennis]|nr:hypothetical protein J6590_046199 [Homalodisca vitripennis]
MNPVVVHARPVDGVGRPTTDLGDKLEYWCQILGLVLKVALRIIKHSPGFILHPAAQPGSGSECNPRLTVKRPSGGTGCPQDGRKRKRTRGKRRVEGEFDRKRGVAAGKSALLALLQLTVEPNLEPVLPTRPVKFPAQSVAAVKVYYAQLCNVDITRNDYV